LSLALAFAVGSAVALSVSPAQVALVAPASRALELRNTGAERLVVDVTGKSVRGRRSTGWLTLRPAHVALAAGATARLLLRAGTSRSEPGDHEVLLLVAARPARAGGVAVRVRLGVRVRVRMPGRIVRHLAVNGLRVRRHRGGHELLVSLTNLGNVAEQLRGQLAVTLLRNGRVVSLLRPRRPRELWPRTRAVVALHYGGRVQGLVTAVVKVRGMERRYRLRL
jgi:hypothetical protein